MARREAPQFPIAAILEHLGGQDVPHVHGSGHAKLLCPFHSESNKSASVSEFGFKCFGCGKQGDAIKLIRDEEGLSYQDAVARCEELAEGTYRAVSRERGWGDLIS